MGRQPRWASSLRGVAYLVDLQRLLFCALCLLEAWSEWLTVLWIEAGHAPRGVQRELFRRPSAAEAAGVLWIGALT